ncbi:MAG: SagB/ThcOx family dehydrogenase [Spirochaetales bacterium]|nr:SagB/ThcOx family dehydrogenase [Spirochaetales bacterium]
MAEKYAAGRKFLKANWHLLDDGFESDQKLGVAAPPLEKAAEEGATRIPLPHPASLDPLGPPLLELLRSRKSRRKYADAPLSLAELSYLCWAADGVREARGKFAFRTAPSGGARHPFELYVYAARVEGMPEGLYYFEGIAHALRLVRPGALREELDAALLGQFWGAAAVFVWAAVPYRNEWRYGPVSHKLTLLDAGHACQNLYLACESIGAGTCAIGAYHQEKLDAFLGLDGVEEFAIYAAPAGKAPAERS